MPAKRLFLLFVFFFARSESEICYFEALISGRWDASSTSCSLGALLSKDPTSTRLFRKSRKWTTNSLMDSLPWRETLWKSCWLGSIFLLLFFLFPLALEKSSLTPMFCCDCGRGCKRCWILQNGLEQEREALRPSRHTRSLKGLTGSTSLIKRLQRCKPAASPLPFLFLSV